MNDGREPAAPAGDGGLVRVRLDLAYDGGEFSGWARQPGLRTVQGEVEDRARDRAEAPAGARADRRRPHRRRRARDAARSPTSTCRRACCARTWPRRCNGVLADDVRVTAAGPAPPGFDARFSALSRAYRYRIADGVPDPLRRHDTYAHRRPLDAAAMHEAATALLGEHDFAAFCRRREGATTVRTLLRLDVARGGRWRARRRRGRRVLPQHGPRARRRAAGRRRRPPRRPSGPDSCWRPRPAIPG